MPYIGVKPENIISTKIDTTTGTFSGEVDAGSLDVSGNADIDGTLEADVITINGTAIASVLSPVAGSSSIVTTGALNSGSITSGFGNIDTGSSTITTTGAITGGTLTGTLQTAAQTNITSVGTLTNFRSTGIDDNADALAITIDSSENVFVTKTSSDVAVVGQELRSSGFFASTRDGATVSALTRLSSDGTILEFRKDSSAVGSISYSNDTNIAINNANSKGIGIGSTSVFPTDGSTSVSNGGLSLGYGNGRWNNLYLSGNIYLGGTGSANALDDYEEGTFTPTAGTDYGSFTNEAGYYVKTGQIVHVYAFFSHSGASTTANNRIIGGLPFTVKNLTSGNSSVNGIFQVWSQHYGLAYAYNDTTNLYDNKAAILKNSFAASASVRVQGFYLTDS
jgi:cytoskeletal protein CcmA (bactofilin family)